MPIGDAKSSGHLVLSHFILAYTSIAFFCSKLQVKKYVSVSSDMLKNIRVGGSKKSVFFHFVKESLPDCFSN